MPSRLKNTPWLALFLLGVVLAVARWHTYSEPLERDITIYTVISHGMHKGGLLYTPLWEHKPPATMTTYWIAEFLTGYGPASVFMLNILAGCLTLVGLFKTASQGGPSNTSLGLWAATLWTLVSGDLYLQGNQPNSEVFINACLIWAFALFVRPNENRLSLPQLIGIGLLIALATLYKQVVIVIVLGWIIVDLTLARNPVSRRQSLVNVAVIASTATLIWIGVCAYFAATHRLQIFWDSAFTFNRYYATHNEFGSTTLFANIARAFTPGLVIRQWGSAVTPLMGSLFLLGCVGFLLNIKARSRSWWLWAVYVLGAEVAVGLPGQLRPHYFQLLLPPLILGAVWSLDTFRRFFRRVNAGRLIGIALTGLLLLIELPYYALSADEWSRRKYGDEFIGARHMGELIDKLLAPDETFYEWGSEAGLYFYSRRQPPTIFNNIALTGGPLQEAFTSRVLNDLNQTKPELFLSLQIILNHTSQSPVLDWVQANYRPIPYRNPAVVLMARRGGHLEERLKKAKIL